VFGDHRTFDQSSTVDVTGRRLNPMVACALPGLGEPLSVAVVWEKRNPTGPDIWATWSSAGPSGFSTPKPVSNEATTLTATNPSLMLVPGEDGADVLVAYHEQMRTLMNVGNTPVSVVTSSRAMVAIKRAVTSTFETPKQISRTSDVTYAGMPSLGYIDGTIPKLVVVWDDNRHRFTSGTDIFCAISSNRGNSWGQDFVLVGDGGTQRLPAAYVNPAGKLRLAYRDETRPVRDGIQFRRVN
ncbi:MAG TPA: hypothetical protein VEI97_08945, partial [bacterium]|nr:hypothetical protein [bacterium]